MNLIQRLTSLFVLLVGIATAADTAPRYFSARPGSLAKAKEQIAAGDKQLAKALKKLIRDADKALAEAPPTVMSKDKLPPSGDKHDYMSIAPYFWPNPDTKDGLPYLRHDGKVNPASRDPKANDSPAIKIMGDNVETLALAYYFTGKDVYAEGAAKVVRVWFLDPATRMNPHLKYAQAIMGKNDGRGTGILEAIHLSVAADALGLLAGSKAWPEEDQRSLKDWLGTYHDWLIQSDAGKDEHSAKNNHGTFYDVQAVRLALVLGRDDSAKRMLEEAKQRRIAVQIAPDGRQPLELDRTTSFSYSRFNLEALKELATLGDHVGIDLWNYTTEDGRSIRKAIDYMLPYADVPPKPWPLPQIKDKHESEFMPIFRQAAIVYGDHAYESIIAKYEDSTSKRFQLTSPISVRAPKLTLDVAAVDRERILKAATAALEQKSVSITTTPAKLSEGGSNDFYSNGDYWWPDPSTPDGLPYIKRDGETNSENFIAHRMAVKALRDSVAALAAAYKITGDDKYVTKAAELLKVFFLDAKTRMNPSLNYAQAVPGVSPGRGIGIIDTLHIIEIPAAVKAMEKSKALPADMAKDLRQWFRKLAEWMTTSKNGNEEANAKNNHAVAFHLQLAVFADFIGDQEKLALCRTKFKEVFVAKQMAEDGSFPLELARTKPYGYSIFQLDNMTLLCQVLSTPEDNLWTFETKDGKSIANAIAYLYPFLADKSKWTLKPDVNAWEGWPARQPNLIFGGLALSEQKYLDLWQKLPADPTDPEVQRNIGITQPVLWVK